MDLFHRIDDAEAIVRVRGGVYKQTEVYRRADKVYVKANGGFARLTAKFGDAWGTSCPTVSVVDISQNVPGLFVVGQPRWTAP